MSRALHKLSSKKVEHLKEPGRYPDGGNLYLRITSKGAKAWVFIYAVGGKRSDIGLGAASKISLSAARSLATKMREAVALGSDPRECLPSKERVIPPTIPTFGEFAESYIAGVEDGWKNAVHRTQWRNSLRDHAKNLLSLPVDKIG